AVRPPAGREGIVDQPDRGELWELVQPALRAARPPRRDNGAGRRLVHGPVLRAVLSADGVQGTAGRLECDYRRGAADRYAVLHLLRLALRPDWTETDYPGRHAARRGD